MRRTRAARSIAGRDSDQIVVLHGDRVPATGTHEHLSGAGPLYRQCAHDQGMDADLPARTG